MEQSARPPSLQMQASSLPPVPSPTHVLLEEELQSITDWQGLGLQLGLENYILQQIMIDENYKVARCRRSMLSKWLKSVPTASWLDIVHALAKMGEYTLANAIEFKYSQGSPIFQRPGKRITGMYSAFDVYCLK